MVAPLTAVSLNTPGSRPPRKKKRGRATYAAVDLDSADGRTEELENIRVWNISKSETTGRVSATRKNHKHAYASLPVPLREESPPIEHIDAPANPEQPPTEPGTKRKRARAKIVKDNDSVSLVLVPSITLTITRWQTNMEDWLGYFSVTLDEILRMDGLGDSTVPGTCADCSTGSVGKYRCLDCWDDNLYCSRCLLSSHRRLPLHRIEVRATSLESRRVRMNFTSRSGSTAFSNVSPWKVSAWS